MFILTSCRLEPEIGFEYPLSAVVNIQGCEFVSVFREESIEFTSNELSEPIVYSDNKLTISDVSFPCEIQENSPFFLSELISDIESKQKSQGLFNGIEYICEIEDGKLVKLVWGKITANFNNLE